MICEGKAQVLDYYDAALPDIDGNFPDLIDVEALTEEQTVEAIQTQLGDFVFFRALVRALAERLGPVGRWKAVDLKHMDDSGEPYRLPPECGRPKTAAIRQNPAMMYADPSVVALLSPGQRGVLRMHETFYLIAANLAAQTNSSRVRHLMNEVLKKNPNRATLAERIEQIWSAGAPTTISVKAARSGKYFLSVHTQYDQKPTKFVDVTVDPVSGRVKIINRINKDLPTKAEFDCSTAALTKPDPRNTLTDILRGRIFLGNCIPLSGVPEGVKLNYYAYGDMNKSFYYSISSGESWYVHPYTP